MQQKVISDISLKSTVHLKYVDWRRRISAVCRGRGEVASRGMKELLSGWKLRLPSARREAIGTNENYLVQDAG